MNKYTKMDKIVTNKFFEMFVLVMVMLNMVVIIAANFVTEEEQVYLDYIDQFFIYFFLGEFIMKLIGLGFKEYFLDPWNQFDFFLVISSIGMDLTLNILKGARGLKSAKSLKVLKTLRS